MARLTLIDGWDFSPEQLMTPAQVARIWQVDPKTVTRWAQDGKLISIRTLGDHRRYSREQVESLIRGIATPPQRIAAEVTS